MLRVWSREGRARGVPLPVLLALALVVSACGPATPPPAVIPGAAPGLFVAGYHPWWAGIEEGAYPMGLLDQLFFFEVEAGEDGGFLDLHGWPEAWTTLLIQAEDAGVQLVPTLTMHDPEAFEAVFSDPGRSARLADAVMSLLAATPALRGIHLDLEVFQPVSVAARDGYTAFAAGLARRMNAHDPGLGLSIFLLAFDDNDAFNERALAEIADYVVVQGYDLHNRNDVRAGPVAPLEGWDRLNWGAVADRYAALGIPPGKILMAAPLYGYQWPTESPEPGAATRGPGVALPLVASREVLPELPRAREQAALHGVQRDPESGSPYYAFQDGSGGWEQGWFDDEQSLSAKIRFVRRRGLGGIAFFPLVYGDEPLWESLKPLLKDP